MLKAKVAAHLILVNGRNEILMLRRFNTGFKDGEYGLVAGHVEDGESLKSAMIREAREEASIVLSPDEMEVVGVIPSLFDEYVYFFLSVDGWCGDAKNMEPDKCDDMRWFHLGDLPENTVSYIRQAIGNYVDGKWFSEIKAADI
ncbi:MAG: NUDIX domain-containing protein [Chloroflexi bacterium]|nr:NUDIX domain-containing protein [Chloroflexota bacterium]